ncbi:MAG: hypothetical protein QW521_02785 [Desulfurococcaceae archaeon]
MAPIRDAVRLVIIVLLMVSIPFLTLNTIYAEESRPIQQPEIQVYYDSSQPSYYLFDYKLRLLILLNDGRESCWERINNTMKLVCKPLKDASVKIIYVEAKEYRDAATNEDGVAEASFKLITYPIATFKVQVYSKDGYSETTIRVGTKIWMVMALASFSLMMGSLVLVVRRCLW